jgi:dTDP-4-amino-4,6-dideoxygalactose transaminase
MYKEIGSSFWVDRHQEFRKGEISLEHLGVSIRDMAFLSTGRSAISFVLNQLDIPEKRKVALLPPFTCYTVIDPFIDAGYHVHFYSIDRGLIFDSQSLMDDIARYEPSVVLVHSYFGFDTLAPLKDALTAIRESGIILIEDMTHMLYSSSPHAEADYYVGSFRKWAELPDRGFVISTERALRNKPEMPDLELQEAKLKAYHAKYRYMMKGEGDKRDFMEMLRAADEKLETQDSLHTIAPVSLLVQANLDSERLRSRRRENYQVLLDGFVGSETLRPVFPTLTAEAVPLYFPVYVNQDRKAFQAYLAAHQIYAPVVWPRPVPCENAIDDTAEWIYAHVLSIPCDQRYGKEEMDYIVEAVKAYA